MVLGGNVSLETPLALPYVPLADVIALLAVVLPSSHVSVGHVLSNFFGIG